MTRTALAALASLVGLHGTGPAQAAQHLLPAKSEIGFAVRQMGVPVQGRFRRFDAELAFTPASPQTGSVQLSIDTASAGFGVPELDTELAKSTWLDVAHFPRAVFRSTSIRQIGPDRFEVLGRLSIKGIDREQLVPMKLAKSGGTLIASGSFAIRRLDFKVGDGEWRDPSLVADDVQVRFSLAVAGTPSR